MTTEIGSRTRRPSSAQRTTALNRFRQWLAVRTEEETLHERRESLRLRLLDDIIRFCLSEIFSIFVAEGKVFNVDELPSHPDPERSTVGLAAPEISDNLVDYVHA